MTASNQSDYGDIFQKTVPLLNTDDVTEALTEANQEANDILAEQLEELSASQ